MEARFLHRRFALVAGKGGVGKSTVCAAMGLAAARAGLRTIVAELNTREKVPQLFGGEPHGYEAARVRENLYSMNITPGPALREYALRKVRFERVYRAVFENDAMRRLLRVIPGMNDLLLLGKAFDLERERERGGRPRWDLVIVDAPATGHGVGLLRLPHVILDMIRSGPLADEVREMQRLLTDPDRSLINLVALPEEMPVRETAELRARIDDTLRIPPGYMVVNGLWPRFLDEAAQAPAERLREAAADRDPSLRESLDCLHTLEARRSFQEPYRQELHRIADGMPAVEFPWLFQHDFGAEAIETLSEIFARQAEAGELSAAAEPPPKARSEGASA